MRQVLLPLSERDWLAVQTVALAGPEKVIVKAVVVLPHITGSSACNAGKLLACNLSYVLSLPRPSREHAADIAPLLTLWTL